MSQDQAILIYSIMIGRTIDIGRIVYKTMTHTAQSKCEGLWFPSLITAMCKQAGVHWDASEELLHLKLPIDLNLILRQSQTFIGGSSSSTHHLSPLDQDTNSCQ
ncbi:Uncharacterized protein TCM_001970 [Theobroma cacao]|uniref:Uncharacterized protein n=1 Tax=Theobroma cacao TaxID=3641 RepID=A0A061DT24_THECC|nr:Uncharacterized protein TCM_001970 [Theobroma cacao]